MTRSYEGWEVDGYRRPAIELLPDGTRWPSRDEVERVAVITDPRGWTWEVVVEDGRVEALTVRPHPGRRLDSRVLKDAPLGYLRDAATSFWRSVDAELADPPGGINVTPVEAAIDAVKGEPEPSIGKPTPETFAKVWANTEKNPVVSGKVTTRREALRRRYRRPDGTPVSLATIDSWLREARDKNLIAPATTGRGNKTPAASDRRVEKGTQMHDEEKNDKDPVADAIRKMRDLAPAALEVVREQARNGKTAKVRAEAKAYLEERGLTVDGDEPYTFRYDPRVDD